MTSSPGLLQHRNSASSTPKINLCREVLYPPPLGQAYTLPMSSSVSGWKHVWKFRFSAPKQPALLAGAAFGLLPFEAASPGTGMHSWSRAGFQSQLPLCVGVLLDARSPGSWERLCGVTHSAPQTPPLPKGGTNPSLMDEK